MPNQINSDEITQDAPQNPLPDRAYSLEEMRDAWHAGREHHRTWGDAGSDESDLSVDFNKWIKSMNASNTTETDRWKKKCVQPTPPGQIRLHIPFKRLHPDAKMPTQAHPGDAAYDLYANERCEIWQEDAKGGATAVGTGIAMAIPHGYVGLIKSRSGLAAKEGIRVEAGVIDASYRGEILVLLTRFKASGLVVKPGDRIAQLLIQRREDVHFIETDELPPSERGEGGLGSSGK